MFDSALQHASPAYALGAKLAEMFPDRHLIEGPRKLDLRSFAHAGHCTVELHADTYHQHDAFWSEEHGVYRIPEVAWHVATWEASKFDVVVRAGRASSRM